ncbi:hypothetical protein [Paractinoplanes durhamensis]|uniref:hypothetical protein n=1 Tax=Paractinoplanes durhamensis TaxID=113563 RepID=UPI003643550C
MFEATAAFAFFDYFRIPYRIVPFAAPAGRHALRVANAGGPLLTWPSGGECSAGTSSAAGRSSRTSRRRRPPRSGPRTAVWRCRSTPAR